LIYKGWRITAHWIQWDDWYQYWQAEKIVGTTFQTLKNYNQGNLFNEIDKINDEAENAFTLQQTLIQ